MLSQEYHFPCPHCGADNGLLEEPGMSRQWVQDCEVCCRPILVRIRNDGDVQINKENE